MTSAFSRFRNWIGGKKPDEVKSVLSTQNKNGKKEHILDSSLATLIDLPQITKRNFEEERKPQEYWKIYNNGVSFYNKKLYEKAKNEFLKLLDFKNPHHTFYTYLLRTYRKMITKEIENRKLRNAYKVFQQFFNICEGYITDTDRRKFNKLIDKLLQEDPRLDYQKVKLVETERKSDLEIIEFNQNSLTLLDEKKLDKKGRAERRNWSFIGRLELGIIYIKSLYDKEQRKYEKSLVIVTDSLGHSQKEFTVNHNIYRFKAAEDSDKFLAASDDMILYFYSIEDGCLCTYNLKRYAENKNHVRCVDISPEGRFLLFTHIDRAFLMDSSLRIIENWRTPHKVGWVKETSDEADALSGEHRRSLSVLGLSGEPTYEVIKSAFRNMVLRYHPDRNPNDPRAAEKTRETIQAYERLTGEEAKLAFRGMKNAEYYYKMIYETEVEMLGTSMCFTIKEIGAPEDWIYATWLSRNADRIYLGCYSGKVYCVSKDGRVKKLYDCHAVVRSIREKGKYLFIQTDYCLYVIEDDECLTHVDAWRTGKLRWSEDGFMFVGTKELRLFSDEGGEIGRINFKNRISGVYWTKGTLNVVTASKAYLLSIS